MTNVNYRMTFKWIALALLPTVLTLAVGQDGQTDQSEAKPHSLPFQAAFTLFGNPIPNCGGALISPNYVLASAQCSYGVTDAANLAPMTIVLGDHDNNITGDGEKHFKIESKVDNPNFDITKSYAYDFALYKLAEPVELTTEINYVCLPTTIATAVC